ncbi:prepilin-type N-terminal cleavage/methylation domain-containing protein [Variovorax sp. YR752]|uniref:prepilin-type N-terminal cleavage/methylation domain-containing protein n=1 Tax=Variovorax sp. YR752 TaxID=1884383 RepID=UPI003137B60D
MHRNIPPAAPRRARGFTVIEVMIAVGLVAVLLGVAMPLYNDYRERVRESIAVQDIAAMASLVQRFQLDSRELPDSLADIGSAGKLDPWGRPYVYYNVEANGKGHARKDRRLNPLNTDFDLYSLGRDGKTKPQVSQKDSLDDLIRANNGRYVGLAANY